MPMARCHCHPTGGRAPPPRSEINCCCDFAWSGGGTGMGRWDGNGIGNGTWEPVDPVKVEGGADSGGRSFLPTSVWVNIHNRSRPKFPFGPSWFGKQVHKRRARLIEIESRSCPGGRCVLIMPCPTPFSFWRLQKRSFWLDPPTLHLSKQPPLNNAHFLLPARRRSVSFPSFSPSFIFLGGRRDGGDEPKRLPACLAKLPNDVGAGPGRPGVRTAHQRLT